METIQTIGLIIHHGCVPHYYLNDGCDYQDGSDEDGAVPTSECISSEDLTLCRHVLMKGFIVETIQTIGHHIHQMAVFHYYLNDDSHDCQDGSDEDGAVPTSECISEDLTLCRQY